jgi:hypothetical protein
MVAELDTDKLKLSLEKNAKAEVGSLVDKVNTTYNAAEKVLTVELSGEAIEQTDSLVDALNSSLGEFVSCIKESGDKIRMALKEGVDYKQLQEHVSTKSFGELLSKTGNVALGSLQAAVASLIIQIVVEFIAHLFKTMHPNTNQLKGSAHNKAKETEMHKEKESLKN